MVVTKENHCSYWMVRVKSANLIIINSLSFILLSGRTPTHWGDRDISVTLHHTYAIIPNKINGLRSDPY